MAAGSYKSPAQFGDNTICAGHLFGRRDACTGDSGGPLMLPIRTNGSHFPFYQIGIVSFGIGCGRPCRPGIYVNVAHYADWISKKIL